MSYQNIDSPCCTSETSIILQVDSISVEKENIPWLTFWRLIAFASMFAQVLILYEITTWLQTGHMDSLTILETRDLKSASLGAHQGVGRRGFSRSLWGEDALPCLCYWWFLEASWIPWLVTSSLNHCSLSLPLSHLFFLPLQSNLPLPPFFSFKICVCVCVDHF